jgi:hypothetical protein
MEQYYQLNIRTRVSLILCTVDDYTARPRSGGNIVVSLREHPGKRPVRKPEGYYIFTDLNDGMYGVAVRSDVYMAFDLNLPVETTNPGNKVSTIILKPASHYPFPSGATLIRASLRDMAGQGLPGAGVRAVMASDNCARARLSVDVADKGLNSIGLANVKGPIWAGDEYLIRDKDDKKREFCRIAGTTETTKGYLLDEPLQLSYARGAILLPVINTRSDDRGEVVVYFREPCPDHFKVKLQFEHQKNLIEKELDIEGGKTVELGVVNIGQAV